MSVKTIENAEILSFSLVEEPLHPDWKITLKCSATHAGYWHCAMIDHPETPDQHYFVADR